MNNNSYRQSLPVPKHLYRIMKLTIVALVVCLGSLFANDAYPQAAKISLTAQQMSISEVLRTIEKQTDYLFVYDKSKINANREVTLNVTNRQVSEVLSQLFQGTDVSYQVIGKNITLMHQASASIISQQEEKKITGTVVDINGESIIGANIVVKGTTNGIITDFDGKFSLNVPTKSTLLVTYIGYLDQEIVVARKSSFNIILKEDSELLEEVVVVGYGTVKKRDLTGSVAAIKGSDLAARKTTQLTNALQGAISGVMVTRDNGAPGESGSIKVRGVTTIGNTDPLVIVDGVPGSLDDVNPNDVESLSVLKDAASSSIYGARAAAGVIVITTKRAKETDLSLNYQFEYGMEIPTQQPEYVNIERYLQMTNELRYNDNPAGGKNQTYSDEQIENWRANNQTDPNNFPMTDMTDLMMRSSAPRQTHTINLTGGSKHVKSKASFIYDRVEGLTTAERYYERFMIRTNNDFTFNKYIGAELDMNFKRTKTQKPYEDSFYNMRISSPVYAAVWNDGRIADGKSGNNPYGQMMEGGTKTSWYNKVGARAALNITPIEGLKVSAVIAPTYNFEKGKNFRKKATYTNAEDPTIIGGTLENYSSTKLNETRNDNYNVTIQAIANYDKSFGKHNLNLMAGYETYYSFWENLSASRDLYELSNYPYLDLGPQSMRDNGGNASELAYRSYFGRVIYSYDNRYMFQANIRHDGSSRFHKDFRWGTFPSVSVGWVLSEEAFIKEANIDWLSFLKLRGSYGTLGNERIGDNYYPYQGAMAFSNVLFYQNGQVVSELSAAQWDYAIQNISWETTSSFDIGLDVNFLNNRLRFTGDYYKKTTKDMLLALEIPDYVGFDNPQKNTGKMHTYGYDLDLSWTDQIGEFNYSIGVNLSDFTSKMGDLGGTQFLGSQVKMEGSEFNEWYGYLSDGLFLTQADLDASPKLNNNIKVGDLKYKDISGPDGIPDGKISPEYDRTLLGGSLPRYMYGANIRLGYKGFDFSMAMQGVGSRNVMMGGDIMQPLRNNWGNIPSIIDGEYWSPYNTDEQNASAFYPRMTYTNQTGNYNTSSDYYQFNGRYFRLKNITFGYTLPKELTDKVMMKRTRVYFSANDLFCLSQYPKGWDPEMNGSAYPITTSILFGVSVNF